MNLLRIRKVYKLNLSIFFINLSMKLVYSFIKKIIQNKKDFSEWTQFFYYLIV